MNTIIACHLMAFLLGFSLDLMLGDPHFLPHPIRLIGKLIEVLEKKLNSGEQKAKNGVCMVVIVIALTAVVSGGILAVAYGINILAGMAVEIIMTYQILATKSLKVESMKVYERLNVHDFKGARQAVSMIVGRDTDKLNDIGVTKAAIETVAENTSDGVIAPMIYAAIGGPVLGFIYKAINTMDSMVGYKNERFLEFGRAAAKTDDVVNFIPSRISAYLMMLACLYLGPDFSAKNAYKIHKRDSRKHESPNSAQTESTCAGALGIQLAGDASYFGEIHKKPFIGDATRKVVYEDIIRVNKLMYATAYICEMLCVLIIFAIVKLGM